MNSFASPSRVPYVEQEKSDNPLARNSLAGSIMPRRPFSPQELQELRTLASQWGKIIARRAFGDAGPSLDIDLDAMEQVAQAAAAGLTEGTLQTCLEQQAQALGPQQPCPACGRHCPIQREARSLAVRGGRLQQSEPVCHCPDCRRDFFPPPPASAP